ncbi:MAG: hypothetical protein HKN19_12250 [Halioglobus sp.]|nr:hypothetical protein [Halioglobus sp.]
MEANPTHQSMVHRLLTSWGPFALILLVAGWYASFIYQHAINVPYADDVEDVLEFMNAAVQSTGFSNTFNLFFEQFNEHRTGATRLVYWASYALSGEINFRGLIFLTNLALGLVLLMLYVGVRGSAHPALLLLPAALILFQIRAFMLQFWTMSGYAYMYVLVFGFVAIICLHRVTPARFACATLFAVAAAFTLASGQIAWLVGLLSLAHQAYVRRSASARYLFLWLGLAVVTLVIYRVDYVSSDTFSVMLPDLFRSPLHYIGYFLALLGNAVTGTSVALAVCAGLLVGLLTAALLLLRWREENVQLELFALYLVLSIGAMTVGRALLTEVSYALSSRYTIPSIMLFATVAVMLGRSLAGRPAGRVGQGLLVVLALVYTISSHPLYRPDLQRMLQMQVNNFNQGNYWTINLPRETSRAIVEQSIDLGIYKPPARPLPRPSVSDVARKGTAPPKFRQIEP